MKTIFIVEYSTGDWDDYCVNSIFATSNEKTAIRYVNKFNDILEKWKNYYRRFQDKDGYLDDNISNEIGHRYYQIIGINKAFYYKLELR